ncbi:acyl-CoA dehydrogenase family protein [Cellulosilyticum ruminicola]|uniref:acyl-CoA dehydrogenase family protein n=1 Tax=Cellulosilyticum ruminicola TaxID=425254 RepID=UPI0006CF569E|nr:acyl-CoA dehydrogenase family protein [Cellulosilyticum ruminicola]
MFIFNDEEMNLYKQIKDVINQNYETWQSYSGCSQQIMRTFAKEGVNVADFQKVIQHKKLDVMGMTIMIYEIAKFNPSLAHKIATTNFGFCYPLIKYGTDEQMSLYLPSIISGEREGVLGCNENATDVRSILYKKEDAFVVKGSKTMLTNVREADYALTLVTSGEAAKDLVSNTSNMSVVIIEINHQAVNLGETEVTMGLNKLKIADMDIRDYPITPVNILKALGEGGNIIMDTTNLMRLSNAAISLGICENAYNTVHKYFKEYGKEKLENYELIQYELAQMKADIEWLRLGVFYLARLFSGDKKRDLLPCSVVKLQVTENAKKICNKCIELVGRTSCYDENILSQAFRDIRIMTILGGHTSKIKNYISLNFYR